MAEWLGIPAPAPPVKKRRTSSLPDSSAAISNHQQTANHIVKNEQPEFYHRGELDLPEQEQHGVAAKVETAVEAGAAEVTAGGEAHVQETGEQDPFALGLVNWLRTLDAGEGALLEYLDYFDGEFDGNMQELLNAAQVLDPRMESGLEWTPCERIDLSFWDRIPIEDEDHKSMLAQGIVALAAILRDPPQVEES